MGYTAVAFGVWDIFYYVFLWLFAGWPASLFDQDILFLIPLPWWGPVVSPALLAALMVVAGAAAMAREFGDGVPRLGRADCIAILRQLCDGLAAAHDASVLHRDFKSGNVMLVGARAVITDFGLAKVLDNAGGPGANTSVVGLCSASGASRVLSASSR